MSSKHDLLLCKVVVLMLAGAIYYVQTLIFHLVFGIKVFLIDMFSDVGNVNKQNQLSNTVIGFLWELAVVCLAMTWLKAGSCICTPAANVRVWTRLPSDSSHEVRALPLFQLLASLRMEPCKLLGQS